MSSAIASAFPCGFEVVLLGKGPLSRAGLRSSGARTAILLAELAYQPIVALGRHLAREAAAPGRDDASVVHDGDEVGSDVVEDALVVGDQEHPKPGTAKRLDSLGHRA